MTAESNDLDLPDIQMPDPACAVATEPEVEEDQKKVAIKFGFIGLGQAGGKIANEFWRLGYRRVLAINTASNDLAGLEIPPKRQLILGDGSGAGKNPQRGSDAVRNQREDVLSLMKRTFGDKVDRILVLASGGGGTGCGGSVEMVRIAQDYMKSLGKSGNRTVGVLLALPKDSEKGASQVNAAGLVKTLFDMANQDLAPLIIVDNEQIARQWPNASVSDIFNLANRNVVGLLDIFNTLAVRESQFSSFDRADRSEEHTSELQSRQYLV